MANKYYKITDWKGYPNYECLHCAFATLSKYEISTHVDMHMRAGVIVDEPAEVEKLDENFGLDVDQPEPEDSPQDTQKAAKSPKKKKGR